MEHNFQRAKSKENKLIRMQQIMDITDKLFHEMTYHEITLSLIAKEMNVARGGLYKYVSSVEEIFLEIYLQNENKLITDITDKLTDTLDISTFSKAFSMALYNNPDLIKYHQILNAIIETNVSIEKLAEFKLRSNQIHKPLLSQLQKMTNLKETTLFDLYLIILYHSVYLYDRVYYQPTFIEAMKIAQLPIDTIDFLSEMENFIALHINDSINKNSF